MFLAVMVKKWDVEFVGYGIDNTGTDTEAGERARTRHEDNFGNVLPVFVMVG